MRDREIFVALEDEARKRWFPELEVRSKADSWAMSFVNKVIKSFDRFWTTIFYTIFFNTKYTKDTVENWWTLMHELVHCWQLKGLQDKYGKFLGKFIYAFWYGWPISQGIIILLVGWIPLIWLPWWCVFIWLVLAGVHFIPQLPDPGRVKYELEGYACSMYTYNKIYGNVTTEYMEHLVKLFTDMSYFKMAVNTGKIKRKLAALRVEIVKGTHHIQCHEVVKLYHEVIIDNHQR